MTDHEHPVTMTIAQVQSLWELVDRRTSPFPAVHISQGYSRTRVPTYIHVSIGGIILGTHYQISKTGIVTKL